MILKMILKSLEFQGDFDFDFQITTSKMIWILILNHLYLGDLILILKSSTYDDFAHLWMHSTNTNYKVINHEIKIPMALSICFKINFIIFFINICTIKPFTS